MPENTPENADRRKRTFSQVALSEKLKLKIQISNEMMMRPHEGSFVFLMADITVVHKYLEIKKNIDSLIGRSSPNHNMINPLWTEDPLKHIRLQQIFEAGLNVADFVCFPPGKLNEQELRAFFFKHGRISCRHFHENEKRQLFCPFLRDVTDIEAAISFCREHNPRFYSLCNENLVTADSQYAGNIMLLDDRNYIVEYFEGQGTPRDLENMNPAKIKSFRRQIGEPLDPTAPEPLKKLAFDCRALVPHIRPVIVEFSIYPYPVGRRQTLSVCWEWRMAA